MKHESKSTYYEALDDESRLRILANALIDKILAMTPEERAELDRKIEDEKRTNQS